MQINNPSRLIIAVLVVVLIVVAVLFLTKGSSSSPTTPGVAKTGPVIHLKAAAAPKGVQEVIDATNKAPITKVAVSGVAPFTEDVDRSKAIDARYTGSQLTYLELGQDVYAPSSTGCYIHATRAVTSPNIANAYLPSGVAGFSYTTPSANTIGFKVVTQGKVVEHGVVTVGAGHRISGATIYDGAPKPEVVKVTYPRAMQPISAPKKLCAAGTK